MLYILSQTLLVIVAALAFWRGRVWERTTAAILLLNWLGTELAHFNHVNPPWLVIAMDGAVWLYLLYAAIFSGRSWTIWAAAFQLLLMANHLAFIRYHLLHQWAYVTAYYIWGDLLLVALACGVLFRRRIGKADTSTGDASQA